jgi:hypothetical protein
LKAFAASNEIDIFGVTLRTDLVKTIVAAHPNCIADPHYIKNFPPIHATTGGIFCVLCTHGIVYYSRNIMGEEGASDMADALRTLKPKVIVYDYSPGVVAHMKNVDPAFFYGGHGIPGGNSPTFVDECKNRILKTNLKAGNFPTTAEWDLMKEATGNFALVDAFHISNCTKDVDRYCRDVRGIGGFRFILSSEVQEQLWSETGKHVRSLNNTAYRNFVLQWNSIVISHNEKTVAGMISNRNYKMTGEYRRSRRAEVLSQPSAE